MILPESETPIHWPLKLFKFQWYVGLGGKLIIVEVFVNTVISPSQAIFVSKDGSGNA